MSIYFDYMKIDRFWVIDNCLKGCIYMANICIKCISIYSFVENGPFVQLIVKENFVCLTNICI